MSENFHSGRKITFPNYSNFTQVSWSLLIAICTCRHALSYLKFETTLLLKIFLTLMLNWNIYIRVTQIWPSFFNFYSSENLVPFGQIMDLANDSPWQKIFRCCSTNLKIKKSGFFLIFATLATNFISFPDTQWAYKITTKNIDI